MIRSSSGEVPFQTAFTDGTHAGVADLPVAKGGAGQGFGPHDLLEAAFATCLTMTVQMSAAKHGLPLTGVQCEVRIDRSIQGAATLHYALTFDGPLTAEQAAQLRDAASRCPVAKTLTGTIALQPAGEAGAGRGGVE